MGEDIAFLEVRVKNSEKFYRSQHDACSGDKRPHVSFGCSTGFGSQQNSRQETVARH